MRNVEIDKGGYRYKWVVRGVDEEACVEDIWDNQRTRLTDYMAAGFAERYGCKVEVESVRLMTRNQYQAYLERNARRVNGDEGYSMEDFRRDARLVEVLPFLLEGFGLDDEVQGLINEYFDSVSYLGNGDACFMCSVGSSMGVSLIAEAFGCEVVCNQGFDGFYKNDNDRFLLGFWDGEISFLICASQKNYEAQLAELRQFYEMDDNDVCLEVYFDDVHVDNIFVPRENVDMAISAVVQRGYEGYCRDVKGIWETFVGQGKVPDIRFCVAEQLCLEKDLKKTLAEKPLVERLMDAKERADGLDVEANMDREMGLF